MVVATPCGGVVRWRVGGIRIAPCGVSFDRRGDLLLRGRSIGGGSGRWSPRGARARTRQWRSGYRSRSEPADSERPAGWRLPICRARRGRSRHGLWLLPSGRRLRCGAHRTLGRARSHAAWGERRRRFRGSCDETRRRGAATWITGRRRRGGMRRGRRVARRRRSSPRTLSCGRMFRSVWPVPWSRLAVLRSPAQQCPGKVGDTGGGRIGAGAWPGARSRLLSDCGSTTRMTRRCGSATRRSTRRSMSRAEER